MGLLLHHLFADYQPHSVLVDLHLVVLGEIALVVLAERAVEHQASWEG